MLAMLKEFREHLLKPDQRFTDAFSLDSHAMKIKWAVEAVCNGEEWKKRALLRIAAYAKSKMHRSYGSENC